MWSRPTTRSEPEAIDEADVLGHPPLQPRLAARLLEANELAA